MTDNLADTRLAVLRASVARLHDLVAPLDEAALTTSAYPSEWNIAQVLSHLGSSAVISMRRMDDGFADRTTPDDFNASVWDEWNAKTPRVMADDSLAADVALLERLESFTDEQRVAYRNQLGPLVLDFETSVGVRMNEHVLHSWDIVVAHNPSATLARDAVPAVLDNLPFITQFVAKPTGATRTITVRTTSPEQGYTITLAPDSVGIRTGELEGTADIVLPAEAFIRLVYGRLDVDHTPSFEGDPATLDELRRVFPGV